MRRFVLNIAQKRLAAGLCLDPWGSLHSLTSRPVLREMEGGRKGGEEMGKDAISILSDFLATPMVPSMFTMQRVQD